MYIQSTSKHLVVRHLTETAKDPFYAEFFEGSPLTRNTPNNTQNEDSAKMFRFIVSIDKEITNFSHLINSETFNCMTDAFWAIHIQEFPLLGALARILFNIPSSTAFIERFFSIAGIICCPRRGRMKEASSL